ncbi:MAG TPA: right-handed parallel beta-helix repeat-containing protein [bacterium]|nr:right-handed parallel beta-helix repeat-containing protein [bacterium]
MLFMVPVLVLLAAGARPSRGTAAVPVSVFHVDNQNPVASDANPGTAALPLRTIGRAVHLAAGANRNGAPVTVLIHPGTYREAVSLPDGGTPAAMTFQATEAGKAVISGADIWTGWQRSGTAFTHAWPYTWGPVPVPRGWPALQDIVRRREMVFVNGQLLRQVLPPTPLTPGTFLVDEAGRTISLLPGGGVDPNTAAVEVAVRLTLFAASGRANLTVSGLVFEHAATPLDDSAVFFDQMTNLLVHDTVFRWNNWGGLGVYKSTNVTALRNTANYNGGRGMEAAQVTSLRYDRNETSSNNWRGAWGGFYDWAMAGIKVLLIHGGTISHHRAVFNQAHGLWLDTDNQNVTISDGFLCGNLLNGAFIEASQGPTAILRTVACGNGKRGVFTTESSSLTLQDSALYGNGKGQFEVGGESSRTVTNWETGAVMAVRAEHLTLCGNAIASSGGGQDVLAIPGWDFVLTTLRSRRNDWWNPYNAAPFFFDWSDHFGLAGWRRTSGQDTDSVYADPRFTDAHGWNFTPRPGSPWRECAGATPQPPPPSEPSGNK